MQQITCSRCGYTLAGMPGSTTACPNCGQQAMIPGGSSQGLGANPGAQAPTGAQQPANPGGAPSIEQSGHGSGPSYGQPAAPHPPQQASYPPQQAPYPPQQTSYPPQQASYPPQQASYPPQQASYPPQQASYPPQQASYPPQQASYPPQQASYPPQQASYPPQQAPHAPPSGAYGAAQPSGYPGGYAPPATMAPPTPAHRNQVIPIALVVALLLVAGGAYYFIKHNNTSGGTIPSGYIKYTDTGGLYSIGYPNSWSKSDQSGSAFAGVGFTSPDQASEFLVGTLPADAGATTSDLSTQFDSLFSAAAQTLPGLGIVGNTTDPQNVTIAGQTWVEEGADINSIDVSSGNSTAAHMEIAGVVKNGHGYILAYATKDASTFDAVKQQYFTPMINSFAFK